MHEVFGLFDPLQVAHQGSRSSCSATLLFWRPVLSEAVHGCHMLNSQAAPAYCTLIKMQPFAASQGVQTPQGGVPYVRSLDPANTGWAVPNKWDRIIGNIRAGGSGLPSFAQDLQVCVHQQLADAVMRSCMCCCCAFGMHAGT